MSVFRVKLNNVNQGKMDLNPATGGQMATSLQRTIYATGPNGTHRKLKDGETFTDSNYWKRFAYPQVSLDQAFIEVVTDDGSVYSDNPVENTYPVVYSLTVESESTYDDNVVDILGDTSSFASFVQIANQGSTAVKIRLNGSTNAVLDLGGGETQVFNHGDLAISMLEFSNTVSGGSDSDVQVLVSVRSRNNS